MARPPKLTKTIQDDIRKCLASGMGFEESCQYAGIHKGTGYRWLALGEKFSEGPYREFYDVVKRVQAEVELARLLLIREAAFGKKRQRVDSQGQPIIGPDGQPELEYEVLPTWTAAAWLLERQHPNRWGRRDRTQVGDDGKEVKPEPMVIQLADGVKIKPPKHNGTKPDDTVEYNVGETGANTDN